MNFVWYDLGLLVIFLIFIAQFLYRNKKNLRREGLLFLYKTKWGMRLINKTGKKYPKTLKVMSYISITLGFFLMIGMIYLFFKILYLYIVNPAFVKAVRVPPITPLVPYLPQAFKLDFLPPFYFIYWIIILAVIAITHEFSHGIFMRRYGIKIKSTGFGFFPFFLPIFLAAFVEQDEKSMKKAKNFEQMAVLSAGTFANVLTGILGFVVMVLFFTLSFNAGGVYFDSYSYDVVSVAGISMINNVSFENPTYEKVINSLDDGLNEIETSQGDYLLTKEFLEKQKETSDEMLMYFDAPAIRNNLSGAITSINGIEISNIEGLSNELSKYEINETITLGIYDGEDIHNQDITLGKYPEKEKPWLGISFSANKRGGIVSWLSSFKKPSVYYKPLFNGANFIYNLLWWLVLISFSVALVNMLPMGIFDGGRFFYLTILSLTKNQKKAEKWFKFSTQFLLFLLILLMIFWGIGLL